MAKRNASAETNADKPVTEKMAEGNASAETNADKPVTEKPTSTEKSIETEIAEIDELYVHNKISASEYMQRKAALTQSNQ